MSTLSIEEEKKQGKMKAKIHGGETKDGSKDDSEDDEESNKDDNADYQEMEDCKRKLNYAECCICESGRKLFYNCSGN